MANQKKISDQEEAELLKTLKARFEKNKNRHKGIVWTDVETRLKAHKDKLWSLQQMEATGGEPDVVGKDANGGYIFYDCSIESPKGRRSLCYDKQALDSRKEFKPENNVMDMTRSMGIELLTEAQYRELQQLGNFDLKTSSWLQTPEAIRKLGGAIFGDYRYEHVFIYHNGASSYYASRGFRGALIV